MAKKLLTLMLTFVLALPLSTAVFAQEAPAKEKAAKETRWEGTVVRSNPDKSTLTVRKAGSTSAEMTIEYDSSTKWVSQFHGDKKVNDIDASQVKDGDVVICKGVSDKAGVLRATVISKRLSHSN
jgi:biopolymer transport protein ExbD